MIGRVEINILEYPRGQKCFQPGDETVFGEGFTTQILHVPLIDSQFGGFWVAPLPTLPTRPLKPFAQRGKPRRGDEHEHEEKRRA